MLNQTALNTSSICYAMGVRHAVLSPGSRNAPLTISFARNTEITKHVIPDERSAGFIALGIAQKLKEPVVLCCTSGTALLNYAPAVAEAFYRQIPLIVLSADRPPNLIDQRDGQTIRQYKALENHVLASLQFPLIESIEQEIIYKDMMVSALKKATSTLKGPVHCNIPFEEPFYPEPEQAPVPFYIPNANNKLSPPNEIESAIPDLTRFTKKMILVGQQDADLELNDELKKIAVTIPVLGGPLANLEGGIRHADGFLKDQGELVPDLLITTGLSILSKKVKHFLRSHRPKLHLHFDASGVEVDTYNSNPILVKTTLGEFLQDHNLESDQSFLQDWKKADEITESKLFDFKGDYSETTACREILKKIPGESIVHLSNSMPVRYADLFNIKEGVEIHANRGTSGIDGCTSTALGTSIVSAKPNFLLTGDLAFFYDRNAFFNHLDTSNLKIIVFNNSGGGIFRLIKGPASQPELQEYFETRHTLNAALTCQEFQLNYYTAKDYNTLETGINDLIQSNSKGALLEIFTNPDINQKVYKQLRDILNEH